MNKYMEMKQQLGAQIRAKSAEIQNGAMTMPREQLEALKGELEGLQSRMGAVEAARKAEMAGEVASLGRAVRKAEPKKELRDVLASREYARAFTRMLRNGMNPQRLYRGETPEPAAGSGNDSGSGSDDSGSGSEAASDTEVIINAMTIAGGAPAGTDGGFLVPQDISTTIIELRRELVTLADLFAQETVSTMTGWRVVDTVNTAGMTKLSNELDPLGNTAKPQFTKVSYSLDTYGDFLPVSNQLLQDETAGLMAYLGKWFGRRLINQENANLMALLETLTGTSITSDPVGGIKTALNATLDPAISRAAKFLMSQTAYNALDALIDEMGRPLLQPDPTQATGNLLFGRPVVIAPDSLFGEDKANIYVGAFDSFATLFRREPMEMASTDVGGNAFRTYSTEIRGVVRMDEVIFDADAVAALTL